MYEIVDFYHNCQFPFRILKTSIKSALVLLYCNDGNPNSLILSL